jgi:hypothetical protein
VIGHLWPNAPGLFVVRDVNRKVASPVDIENSRWLMNVEFGKDLLGGCLDVFGVSL